VTAAERQAAAMRLRAQGTSYTEIARQLDCSTGTAYQTVQKGLSRLPEEAREELVQLMQVELAALMEETSRIVRRPKPLTYRGQALTVDQAMADGSVRRVTVVDQEVQLQAIATMMRLQESWRRLAGLDGPVHVEHTGQVEVFNRAEAEQSIRDRLASLRPLSLVEVEAQSDVAVEEHDAEAS
jgi:DNA-binding CsgD family transcriptional regulator